MNTPHLPTTAPVPITILTGFLGAGKTTLLNRILRDDHGLRVAVLVNDFGAINIDADLVVGVEEDRISLSNGCICCTIRDDLAIAALNLLKQPEPPEYLLIEASGVSDPVSVAMTFLLPEMRTLFRLDSIITVVDTEQAREHRRYDALIRDQIAAADIVLLNKIDLVSAEQRAEMRRWIETIVPRARVLETIQAHAPLDLLLGIGRHRVSLDLAVPATAATHEHDHEDAEEHDHEHAEDHDHEHDHSAEFSTWSYQTDQPLSLRPVQRALKTLPASVFRAKGVLFLAEAPETRAILHVAGKRVALTFGEPWDDTPPASRLVMIGTPDGVDAEELRQRFEACSADQTLRGKLTSAWDWVRSA